MASSGWTVRAANRVRSRQAELKLALRVTIAGTLAYAVTKVLDLPQGYWAVITAVIVMQASVGGSLKAAVDRFSGTLAGAFYGGVIAAFIPHGSAPGLGLAIVLALFPLALLAALYPSFRVAPVTSLIMLLPPTGQALGPLASGFDRVAEITLGNMVGVAVALFVLPARAHTLMMEAAAKVAALNAELITVFVDELMGVPRGRSPLQSLHPQIRSALKKAEAAAEEAARERRSHLTDRPDPEPLIRTLYRVRHDLVMIGRAAANPLPPALLDRLGPSIRAMSHEANRLLSDLAQALRTGQAPPSVDAFATALSGFVADIEALRVDPRPSELQDNNLGQVFALRFGFEQFRQDVGDLLARTQELNAGRPVAEAQA
jgi:uncharacterized membrane protein YccC